MPSLVTFSPFFLEKRGMDVNILLPTLLLICYFGFIFTSWIVLQEKKRGTFSALFITPLKEIEWIFGIFTVKFLFFLPFYLAGIVLFQRFDLIAQPFAFVNVVLVFGTACFLGVILGLVAKEEKDPILTLTQFLFIPFMLGFFFSSVLPALAPWFPDYHLVELFNKGKEFSFWRILYHSTFNLIFFLVSLIIACKQALFYFSNNGERFYSHWLLILIFCFVVFLILSGFLSHFRMVYDGILNIKRIIL